MTSSAPGSKPTDNHSPDPKDKVAKEAAAIEELAAHNHLDQATQKLHDDAQADPAFARQVRLRLQADDAKSAGRLYPQLVLEESHLGSNKSAPSAAPVQPAAQSEVDLKAKAKEVYEAIHPQGWLSFGMPDTRKVMADLGSLGDGASEFEKIYNEQYAKLDPSKRLRAEVHNRLSGEDAAKADAYLDHRQGHEGYTGNVEAIVERMNDAAPYLNTQSEFGPPLSKCQQMDNASKQLREYIGSMNSKQLKELDDSYRQTHQVNGKSVGIREALLNNENIPEDTRKAIALYLHNQKIEDNGSDKITADDRVKLARMAMEQHSVDMFSEALRGDSDQAKAARRMLASTSDGQHLDKFFPNDLQKARDMLSDGKISIATIGAHDGNLLTRNVDDLVANLGSATPEERNAYAEGRELSHKDGRTLTAAEQKKLDFYNRTRACLNNVATSDREMRCLEDQLLHEKGSLVSRIGETHSAGFGIGRMRTSGSHTTDDVLGAVEHMSKEDYTRYRNDPRFRDDVQGMLKTICTPDELTRANKLLSSKQDANSFEDCEKIKRSATEQLGDRSGSPYSPDDRAKVIDTLLAMPLSDRERYQHDPKFKQELDAKVNTALADQSDLVLAHHLLDKIAHNQNPSQVTGLDRVLLSGVHGADLPQLVASMQTAIKEDPKLLAALKNEPDKPPASLLHDLLTQACYKKYPPTARGRAPADYSAARNAETLIQSQLFTHGQVDFQTSLNLGQKHRELLDAALGASKDERSRLTNPQTDADRQLRQQVLGKLTDDEEKVLAVGLKNDGKLQLVDELYLAAHGDGTLDDVKHRLADLHNDPAKLNQLKDDYRERYQSGLDVDLQQSVRDNGHATDGVIIKNLLTPGQVSSFDQHQDLVDQDMRAHTGAADIIMRSGLWDGTSDTAERALDREASAVAERTSKFEELSPAEKDALVNQYATAIEKFREQKVAASEAVVNVALTAASLAAAVPSGGVSLEFLLTSSAIGATTKVVGTRVMEGADSKNDLRSVSRDAVQGAMTMVLARMTPTQLQGVLKATNTVASDTMKSLTGEFSQYLVGSEASQTQNLARAMMQSLAENKPLSAPQLMALIPFKEGTSEAIKEQAVQAMAKSMAQGVRQAGTRMIEHEVQAVGREATTAQVANGADETGASLARRAGRYATKAGADVAQNAGIGAAANVASEAVTLPMDYDPHRSVDENMKAFTDRIVAAAGQGAIGGAVFSAAAHLAMPIFSSLGKIRIAGAHEAPPVGAEHTPPDHLEFANGLSMKRTATGDANAAETWTVDGPNGPHKFVGTVRQLDNGQVVMTDHISGGAVTVGRDGAPVLYTRGNVIDAQASKPVTGAKDNVIPFVRREPENLRPGSDRTQDNEPGGDGGKARKPISRDLAEPSQNDGGDKPQVRRYRVVGGNDVIARFRDAANGNKAGTVSVQEVRADGTTGPVESMYIEHRTGKAIDHAQAASADVIATCDPDQLPADLRNKFPLTNTDHVYLAAGSHGEEILLSTAGGLNATAGSGERQLVRLGSGDLTAKDLHEVPLAERRWFLDEMPPTDYVNVAKTLNSPEIQALSSEEKERLVSDVTSAVCARLKGASKEDRLAFLRSAMEGTENDQTMTFALWKAVATTSGRDLYSSADIDELGSRVLGIVKTGKVQPDVAIYRAAVLNNLRNHPQGDPALLNVLRADNPYRPSVMQNLKPQDMPDVEERLRHSLLQAMTPENMAKMSPENRNGVIRNMLTLANNSRDQETIETAVGRVLALPAQMLQDLNTADVDQLVESVSPKLLSQMPKELREPTLQALIGMVQHEHESGPTPTYFAAADKRIFDLLGVERFKELPDPAYGLILDGVGAKSIGELSSEKQASLVGESRRRLALPATASNPANERALLNNTVSMMSRQPGELAKFAGSLNGRQISRMSDDSFNLMLGSLSRTNLSDLEHAEIQNQVRNMIDSAMDRSRQPDTFVLSNKARNALVNLTGRDTLRELNPDELKFITDQTDKFLHDYVAQDASRWKDAEVRFSTPQTFDQSLDMITKNSLDPSPLSDQQIRSAFSKMNAGDQEAALAILKERHDFMSVEGLRGTFRGLRDEILPHMLDRQDKFHRWTKDINVLVTGETTPGHELAYEFRKATGVNLRFHVLKPGEKPPGGDWIMFDKPPVPGDANYQTYRNWSNDRSAHTAVIVPHMVQDFNNGPNLFDALGNTDSNHRFADAMQHAVEKRRGQPIGSADVAQPLSDAGVTAVSQALSGFDDQALALRRAQTLLMLGHETNRRTGVQTEALARLLSMPEVSLHLSPAQQMANFANAGEKLKVSLAARGQKLGDAIFITDADVQGSSHSATYLFRLANGMDGPEYDSHFLSMRDAQAIAQAKDPRRPVVFIDDVIYTGQSVVTRADIIARKLKIPPDRVTVAAAGAYSEGLLRAADQNIEIVNGANYVDTYSALSTKVSSHEIVKQEGGKPAPEQTTNDVLHKAIGDGWLGDDVVDNPQGRLTANVSTPTMIANNASPLAQKLAQYHGLARGNALIVDSDPDAAAARAAEQRRRKSESGQPRRTAGDAGRRPGDSPQSLMPLAPPMNVQLHDFRSLLRTELNVPNLNHSDIQFAMEYLLEEHKDDPAWEKDRGTFKKLADAFGDEKNPQHADAVATMQTQVAAEQIANSPLAEELRNIWMNEFVGRPSENADELEFTLQYLYEDLKNSAKRPDAAQYLPAYEHLLNAISDANSPAHEMAEQQLDEILNPDLTRPREMSRPGDGVGGASSTRSGARFKDIPNFGESDENIYRSGSARNVEALERLSESRGVDTVIDLTKTGSDASKSWAAQGEGRKYVSIPLSTSDLTQEQLAQVAAEIHRNVQEGRKVLVHCAFGRDRTGAVMAYYRVHYDGWTPEQARKEMYSYGYNPQTANARDLDMLITD